MNFLSFVISVIRSFRENKYVYERLTKSFTSGTAIHLAPDSCKLNNTNSESVH